MTELHKINRLEKYLFDFFSSRYEWIDVVYRSTHRDRHTGIYKLRNGAKLMDFLIGIHGNIEDKFYGKRLIPHAFPTPDALLQELNEFKKYLNENQKYIDENWEGEDTDYLIVDIQKIKNELVQAIDYVKILYNEEDIKIPYTELRHSLITNNITDFIKTLKSILASVSYPIYKTQEGFYHSNVHTILKLLGFDIISEENTNNGRIDAVIRFWDYVYIMEFKFSQNSDLSNEALKQIKSKNYDTKFHLENKDIIGIGISFCEKERNINGYIAEKLNHY